MKMQLFALRDTALEAYGAVMTYSATGQAVREFTDQVNDKQSQINKHPEDYMLFFLGTYDNDTGMILQPDQPKQMARAIDVIIRE